MASESPILVLSLDYELFFGKSGSVQRCLIDPCDALTDTARQAGLAITFFVDAGMILCMQRESASSAAVSKMADLVREHVASLAAQGFEIALHVHPHWEESRWANDAWDFSGSRYQLRDYSPEEIHSIFTSYSECLQSLSGRKPVAYRAGGFCVEPFDRLIDALDQTGISIDSSVVPGASFQDPEKGFDYRSSPNTEWWSFETTPRIASAGGRFLELPIATQRLPLSYYWKRLVSRLLSVSTQKTTGFGDGYSLAASKFEILRRLAGISRVAELSIDDPKANHLQSQDVLGDDRRLWHLMGHPKLLSRKSLGQLKEFVVQKGIDRFETVASLAQLIRSGEMGQARSLDK